MKRFRCLLLMATMLFVTLPGLADTVRTSGLYTYKIKGNGTISIVDYNWGRNSGDVYIPNMIDGYVLTAIEEEAFAEETSNENREQCIVTLPSGITMIGAKAFMNAPVSAINIPASTQFIGVGAFANCPLKQFSVAPDNAIYATINGVLYNKTTKTLVAYPRDAGRINIPEGIVKIDDYAFYGVSLGSADKYNSRGNWNIGDMLPSSIVEIGAYAFAESTLSVCSNERGSRLLPDSIVKIGDYAFANSDLKFGNNVSFDVIHLGNEGASIGKGAFQNARIISRDVDYVSVHGLTIGDDAFNSIDSLALNPPYLMLSESIESIGARAFKNAEFDVYIPEWIETSFIGEEAFASTIVFMEAERIVYPDGKVTVSFNREKNTTAFTFPAGDSVIRKNAFNAALEDLHAPIEHLVIPEGVVCIEEGAFANNPKLKNVVFPTTLTKIDAHAFENTSITSAILPITITEIGENAFDRTDVTLIVEPGSYSALWVQENGYGYKYAGQTDDLSWLTGSNNAAPVEDTSWLNN